MSAKQKKSIPAKAALSKEVARLLRWVRFINEFRSIERTIWYKGARTRERNGEHCYQLMMVAWFLVEQRLTHLDLHKICMYIAVHDLVEVYAKDTPAFKGRLGKFDKGPTHATKAKREQAALERINREWGSAFPQVTHWIRAYDRKGDEESRLVYSLDKLLAEINIFEDDGRTDRELGVPLEEKFSYKRPRIAKHPLMLKYYDELYEFWTRFHHDRTYRAGETKEAAE